MIDFKELREAEKKATAGLWNCDDDGLWFGEYEMGSEDQNALNFKFIVVARRDVPLLLAELDRLTAALVDAETRGWEKAKRQAAEIIAANSEHVSSKTNNRYLAPRTKGDLMATAYANAILAMQETKP